MTCGPLNSRETPMQATLNIAGVPRFEGLQSRMVYCALLPMFVVAEGGRRLLGERDETAPRDWFAEARQQTSVATSYASMARSMLQSSERRRRPERLSRAARPMTIPAAKGVRGNRMEVKSWPTWKADPRYRV
jgi:hypothetical protein